MSANVGKVKGLGNQQPSTVEVKVQRLGASRRAKWPEVPGPLTRGEDIVQPVAKAAAAKAVQA